MNSYTIKFIAFILFIIICNYKDIKEGLTSNNKNNILLLGDSMLNNSNYVKHGESVSDIIKIKEKNVNNLALDNSKIKDINRQINKISSSIYNNSNTYVFLSVGGNDILNLPSQNEEQIKDLFKEYLKVIKLIKNKLPKAKLISLNIYHPQTSYYKMYYSSIDLWNNLLNQHTFEGYEVLNVDKLMKNKLDFVHDIEPSKQGSNKIANAIINF